MLQIGYGMGLRVCEVVKLNVSDMDSKRMQVRIENSKGKSTGMFIYLKRCFRCCAIII